MAFYLLDTNVFIGAIKGSDPIRKRLATVPAAAILLSPIVLGELLTGVEKSRQKASNRKRLLQVLEGFQQIPLTPEVASGYADLRATLERRGTPIGAKDTWIAAHALALDAVLVTDNEKEFRRVSGLPIENWLRPVG
jgi:tRNA(fMet)-specific endonuclease VapC